MDKGPRAFQFATRLDRIKELPHYPGYPGFGCPTVWCINPNRVWTIFMDPELGYAELCELYSEQIADRVLTDYFKQRPRTAEEREQFVKDHWELQITEVFTLWFKTHFGSKPGLETWQKAHARFRKNFRERFAKEL